MKNRSFIQIALYLSALILWVIILFCSGVWFAQTEKFQEALKDIKSGAVAAELLPYAHDRLDKQLTVWQTKSHVLEGGALLLAATQSGEDPGLFLVDDTGKILHSWSIRNGVSEAQLLEEGNPSTLNSSIQLGVEDAFLLPGGDVVFTEVFLKDYKPFRLVRMDKDSHIRWQSPGNFHHEIDIAGQPQRIYAVGSQLRNDMPFVAHARAKAQYLDPWIEVYDMDGKKLNAWSVIDAFVRSPYRNLLNATEINLQKMQEFTLPNGEMGYDFLHMNSIQYLDSNQAKALPFTHPGDLLLSFRALSAIAVFRPQTQQIVWAGFGPWRHQHYVHASEDGKLFIYDNEGSRVITVSKDGKSTLEMQSRIIQFDPFTNRMAEIYASPSMLSYYRGYYYQLPDGDWIMSSTESSRVIVVSPEKQVLWELRGVPYRHRQAAPFDKQLNSVEYCPPNLLTFLNPQKTHQAAP
jgi:hypothetical protein